MNNIDLLSLDDDKLDDFLLKLIYEHFHKMPFENLNKEQKVIFLCSVLEDACQADSILSLTENDMFLRLPEIYDAHIEIGADETASLIKEFINLMPDGTFGNTQVPDWDWFFEDEDRENAISDIDGEISDYPDGVMRDLYKKYVRRNDVAEKLLENIQI